MADFVIIGRRELGFEKPRLEGNVLLMNKKGTVKFSLARAKVEIVLDSKAKRYTSQRGVIEAPDGAQILPYFRNEKGWQAVLVEQFRIALPGKTIEAPGGEVDETNPLESMARELDEEAHIKVLAEDIELVFREMIQPSMMAARIWGGIVKIDKSQLPAELLGGEFALGEYTVLVTKPLLKLLQERDARTVGIDLMLSRLIDEVAKRVGLLTKNY